MYQAITYIILWLAFAAMLFLGASVCNFNVARYDNTEWIEFHTEPLEPIQEDVPQEWLEFHLN